LQTPDLDLMDRDHRLDEAIEDSFPASDAPANTVLTGINLTGEPLESAVDDEGRAVPCATSRGPS